MAHPVSVIVGGTRGLGLAMSHKWLENHRRYKNITPRLFVLGRNVDPSENKPLQALIQEHDNCDIQSVHVDLARPESIESAAKLISSQTDTLDYVFSTAGMLHNFNLSGQQTEGKPQLPERSFKEISLDGMRQTFELNTFAHALVIKEFSNLLKRSSKKCFRSKELNQPPVFAALSARVGSISDNRKGGWTSYRASKAALNMILLNAHWEFGMGGRQKVIIMALHPGTVDTNLSKPFQDMAKKQYEIFTPEHSASMLVNLCINSDVSFSGGFYAYDGERIPW